MAGPPTPPQTDGTDPAVKKLAPRSFPVAYPDDPDANKHNKDGDDHFNQDISDIGTKLNSVNNDLFHVLTELQARQFTGLGSALWNLQARDYNAGLSDRDLNTKALKDSSNKFIVDLVDPQAATESGAGLTIAQLENLSDITKQRILTQLTMFGHFNSFIEKLQQQAVLARKESGFKPDLATENPPKMSEALKKAVADNKDIMTLIANRTSNDTLRLYGYEREYSNYLSRQLRIAVGLARCPNP